MTLGPLTKRESEIVLLIADGHRQESISHQLDTAAGLGRALEIALESRSLPAIAWPVTPKDKHGDDAGTSLDRHPENTATWEAYERENAVCRSQERERYQRWQSGYKLGDMLKTTEMYGTLSEKMIPAIQRLAAKHDAYEVIAAERAIEKAAAAPCPAGRVTITGTIVKVEERESQWGIVTKMLVKAVEGYMVWCSVPAAAAVNRGCDITFKATLKPSPDDPKFGFGSRPTMAI